MDQRAITNGIYNALDAIVPDDVTIIVADQNEARPARPYMSFKIMTGPMREGWDHEAMTDDGLQMIGTRTISVSMNYYGKDALGELSFVQSRLQWESIRVILSEKNLVYVSDSGVRDLSQLLETQTETRAQMDVTMRFTDIDTDTGVGHIARVEILDVERGTQMIIEAPEEGDEDATN